MIVLETLVVKGLGAGQLQTAKDQPGPSLIGRPRGRLNVFSGCFRLAVPTEAEAGHVDADGNHVGCEQHVDREGPSLLRFGSNVTPSRSSVLGISPESARCQLADIV